MADESTVSALYFKCRVFESGTFETHEIEFSIAGDDPRTIEFIQHFKRHVAGIAKAVKTLTDTEAVANAAN